MAKLQDTRKLYTKHPFGKFSYNREKYYENALVTRYAKKLKPNKKVYDIGCGKGFLIEFLQKKIPNKIVGVDLSPAAVAYCKKRGLSCRVMNNLHLDFANNVSDFTISNGVIHHTPDARKSFSELVRITKPGKQIYVSVYRLYYYYSLLYWLCAPIRALHRRKSKLVNGFFFPIFHYLYFVPIFYLLERRVIDKATGMTLFADQILTPIATFHTKRELTRWAREEQCTVVAVESERKGQMLSFILEKNK